MSLTSFIKNKDVKEKFAKEFQLPTFNLAGEIKAIPLTKNYPLMGTAFDYMLRFYLKKQIPKAITSQWIAEHSASSLNNIINISLKVHNGKIIKESKVTEYSSPKSEKAQEIIKKAKSDYEKFLKDGNMTDEIIKSCICLAQLDPIYRAGYIYEKMGEVDNLDIQDMKNLYSLININNFKSDKICLLNPTFGKASTMVGGADADLVVDEMLIDIKTTKFLKLDRDHFNQLIGYYFLYLIGGIDGAPKNHKILKLGIYFSRHGLLYITDVNDIIKKNQIAPFIKWLKRRVKNK
jgi:hypothetical protein